MELEQVNIKETAGSVNDIDDNNMNTTRNTSFIDSVSETEGIKESGDNRLHIDIEPETLDIAIKIESTDDDIQAYNDPDSGYPNAERTTSSSNHTYLGNPSPINHEEIIRNWQEAFHGGTYSLATDPGSFQSSTCTTKSDSEPGKTNEVDKSVNNSNIFPLALVQNAHSYNPQMPFNNQWGKAPVNKIQENAVPISTESNTESNKNSIRSKRQRRKSTRPKKVTNHFTAGEEDVQGTERQQKKMKMEPSPKKVSRPMRVKITTSPKGRNNTKRGEVTEKNSINGEVPGKQKESTSQTDEVKVTDGNLISYPCEECELAFTSRRSLNKHKMKHKKQQEESEEKEDKTTAKPPTDIHTEDKTKNEFKIKKKNSVIKTNGTKTNTEKIYTVIQNVKKPRAPKMCDVCGRQFDQSSNLIKHKRVHSGEKPYICDYCGKAFASSSSLVIHRRTHTGERPYKCDLCPATFAQRTTLLTHKIGKHDVSTPKVCLCDFCGKKFPSPSALEIHKRSHTGAKPFICDICGRGFAEASNLKSHKVTHTNVKPFVCSVCNHGFFKQCSLKKHEQLHVQGRIPTKKRVKVNNTPKEAMIYVKGSVLHCGICNEGFIGIKELTKHRQIEHEIEMHQLTPPTIPTNENPKLSSDCNTDSVSGAQQSADCLMAPNMGELSNTDKTLLDISKAPLPEKRPVTFDDCDSFVAYTYTRPPSGPHICQICSKTFISSSHLNLHLRVHTGFKPFICSICKRGFAQLSNCVSHQKIHSGTKDYTCLTCDKKFSRSNHLNKHIEKCKEDLSEIIKDKPLSEIESSKNASSEALGDVSEEHIPGPVTVPQESFPEPDRGHVSQHPEPYIDTQPPPAHTPLISGSMYHNSHYNDHHRHYLPFVPPLVSGSQMYTSPSKLHSAPSHTATHNLHTPVHPGGHHTRISYPDQHAPVHPHHQLTPQSSYTLPFHSPMPAHVQPPSTFTQTGYQRDINLPTPRISHGVSQVMR